MNAKPQMSEHAKPFVNNVVKIFYSLKSIKLKFLTITTTKFVW